MDIALEYAAHIPSLQSVTWNKTVIIVITRSGTGPIDASIQEWEAPRWTKPSGVGYWLD
jgi:hypothetical protein